MSARVPTALKVVRGNPGKRPLNKAEPEYEKGADVPDYLSPAAKKHWSEVYKMLNDAGVLTKVDSHVLGMYCEAFATWRDATDKVAKHGTVIKAPSGFPVQSPFLAIANKAHEQMRKLLIELGMTPASRTKVTAVKKEKTNPFAEIIGKKRRNG